MRLSATKATCSIIVLLVVLALPCRSEDDCTSLFIAPNVDSLCEVLRNCTIVDSSVLSFEMVVDTGAPHAAPSMEIRVADSQRVCVLLLDTTKQVIAVLFAGDCAPGLYRLYNRDDVFARYVESESEEARVPVFLILVITGSDHYYSRSVLLR